MKFATLVNATAVLSCLAVASNAAVIFSDNFDNNAGRGTISSGPVDTSTTGSFTVTGGNIDLVGPGYFPELCVGAESGSCVDMDGSTPGQITSTSIAFAPGTYTLAFDINGSQRGPAASTTITLGSLLASQTYNTNSSDEFPVSFNFTVTSATSAQIVFTSNDPAGDDEGTLIDNVTVTQNGSTTPSVPEPASALLLLGALPLAWVIRKQTVR